jgi:hypothetical protein
MALRMKTRFRSKGPKTIEDRANVVAYNIWKIAQETCRRMEKEGFKFASDLQLAAVITEMVAFLVQIADRSVYGQLPEDERARFVNALGRELAGHMAANLQETGGAGEDHARRFVATLNARFADYAECEYDPRSGPGYRFLRYLGDKVAAVMAATDNKWVVEQVMEIEAPEAVKAVRKLVHEVLGVKIG